MMKKILLVFFALLIVHSARSQVLMTLIFGDKLNSDMLEFGLEGGGNFSKITGLDTKKYFNDWNLGFYFDFLLKEQKPWYLNTGVLVKSRVGAGKLTDNDLAFLDASKWNTKGTYTQKINYFLVPVLMKYRKKHFYVEGGIQAGLMYKAWIEYSSDTTGFTSIIKEHNKDMINRIDVGMMAGTGYRFNGRTGWTIGLDYYWGLTNVYKSKPGTKNQSLFLEVDIPIGRGKCAQDKRAAKKKKKEEKKAAKANREKNK